MKKIALLLISSLLSFSSHAADFVIGADLSFLKQAEDRTMQFKDENKPLPGLQIFKNHGYNFIRLRLFNDPRQLPNNNEYTIALAKKAKEMGFKFFLDFHYSDTWADPQHQQTPRAWMNLKHEELVKAVEDYTKNTLIAFEANGVFPDWVQIGNEISVGMLWPDGQLPENWDNLADLYKAGVRGIDAATGKNPRPKIVLHIDKGGDKAATKYLLDKFNSYKVDYDIIGQSYYPWWHGSLMDLRENLNFMAKEYKKDIILAEVAYNWRPTEYRNKLAPFPETPEGQKQFLEEVLQVCMQTTDNRCIGLFWWEPAVQGGTASRGFFDNNYNALPIINVFDKWTRK